LVLVVFIVYISTVKLHFANILIPRSYKKFNFILDVLKNLNLAPKVFDLFISGPCSFEYLCFSLKTLFSKHSSP